MARAKKPEGDDDALWRSVTRDVAPLKHPAPNVPAPESEAKGEAAKPRPRAAPPTRPKAPPPELPEIVPGHAPGLDKRTAQRLRRGRLALDGRVDLHGMTQDAAYGALHDFLADSCAAGRRCVLVITGKGRISEDGGVLRNMVPRWLNAPPNRARVLAFEPAQAKHGGAGALYVLLRRKR